MIEMTPSATPRVVTLPAIGPLPSPIRLAPPPEDEHLWRARGLLDEAIRRRWACGLLTRDPDGVFTSVLGAEHVDRLLEGPAPLGGPLVEDHLFSSVSPIGQLAAVLGLSASEADLMALLFACETDALSARLAGYLGGNHSQFTLTIDLVFEIVYRGRAALQGEGVALLQRDLGAASWLRRLRLVVVDGGDSRATLAQAVRLHPRVTAWLSRQRGLDVELGGVARLEPPSLPEGECDPRALDQATAALAGGGRLLLVDGPLRSGREMLVRFAAARLGRPLLVVSAGGLQPDSLVAAFREARLCSALLLLRDAASLPGGECGPRLRDCLDVTADTVVLVDAGRAHASLAALRPVTSIAVAVPARDQRLRLWRDALGDGALPARDLEEAASLYNLGVAGIVEVGLGARGLAALAGEPLARRHLAHAVRRSFESDLATVATRVEVTQRWNDLVLPEEVGGSVVALIDRVRHRNDVLGDWGFARKLGKGLGITALFSGDPGTGKSMVAGLIAAELGLDLYVVDLARLTSKWLGETEKNLARAFDAAEVGHVLLLFDEADSVLGKRSSEVRGANDRYANMETNFVLARLEQFQGIAIFTTNLPSAVDPAILRRMSVRLDLPFPDVEARTELWRRMIPDEAPRDGEIEYGALAERYELSGGFIRNIVLRAAYAARGAGQALSTDALIEAAELEYREHGSLVSGGRLV